MKIMFLLLFLVFISIYWLGAQTVSPAIILNRNLLAYHEAFTYLPFWSTSGNLQTDHLPEWQKPKPFELSPEEKNAGFEILFNGTNLDNWTGNTTDYVIEKGDLVIYPENGGEGNIYTKKEYSDFEFRFEFLLTPGANNGLGIRTPLEGDAAYVGMELQILDNTAEMYKDLKPYQYHGSVYGVLPAKQGYLKPVGEWNYEEVVVKGNKIKVTLNNKVILDGDITEAKENGTHDGHEHPGLQRTTGHIGFLGHGSIVRFRNIRINDFSK